MQQGSESWDSHQKLYEGGAGAQDDMKLVQSLFLPFSARTNYQDEPSILLYVELKL